MTSARGNVRPYVVVAAHRTAILALDPMDDLVARIEAAFAERAHPGDTEITRCTYDRVNGGTMDGPCLECVEMAEFFAGKSWRTLGGKALRRYGDADWLFTVKAYCYLLSAYLVASIREPVELDVCIDHLAYRFGPEPGDLWPNERLAQVLGELTPDERAVVHAYFQFALTQEDDWEGFVERALRNLAASGVG
jgi:hypothetical protein